MNQQLNCPNCRSTIPSEDVNIGALIAKCNNCNHVFNFNEHAVKPYNKPEVPMPPGMEMLALNSELDIQFRWKDGMNSFLTFFTIVWNLMMLPFLYQIVSSGEWGGLLALSAHLAVGVGLLYYTICMFVNTTYVTVDRRNLLVEHLPLKFPFTKNHSISTSDIKQVYFERYTASTSNDKPNYAFQVIVILNSEDRINIVKGLRTQYQGRFIEQEIERFLNIKDEPVEEEW